MIEYRTVGYKKITWALGLGSFIVFCNLYLMQPMLPLLANYFHLSNTQVNWVFAATTLGLSVCLVPWAIVSESIGRRRAMAISLFSMPLIGLLMLTSETVVFLIGTRALLGVALAAFAAVAVAYMVEELSPKAFSYAIGGYIAANSLGGICGRIAGGMFTDLLSWKHAVGLLALFTFLGACVVVALLPHQKNFKPQSGLFFHHNRALIQHIKNPKVYCAMLIGGLNFALFVNLYSVMGFRLTDAPHNLSVGAASLIFLCYLGGTVSSKLTGQWTHHFSSQSGMLVGTLVTALGTLIAVSEQIPLMLLGLLLISFGAFFTHTLAYGWVSQKAVSAKSTATALYLVHYYIGGSAGGFWLIYCWQTGGWPNVIAGGSLLFAGIFFLCHKLYQFEPVSEQDLTAKTP